MENSQKGEKRPFDISSFILLALALITSLLAITSLEEGKINWIYLTVFILSLAAFIHRSLTIPKPFLDIRVLKVPTVWLGLIPFFIYQFANLGSNFIIPNFLIEAKGASSTLAGFSLLPGTLLGAILAPVFGKFYDLKGPKPSLYIGNTLFTIALSIMALFTETLTLFSLAATYIVFTFGRNMAFNNILAVSVSTLPQEKKADVTAIFQMMQQFAGALGTAIASVLANSSQNLTEGVQRVFSLQLFLVVIIYFFFINLFQQLSKNS